MAIEVKHFFDQDTFTLTYIVYDTKTKDSVIIDPVLNYNQGSSNISMSSISKLDDFITHEKLKPIFVLETHAHADHLTGAVELRKRFPSIKIAIGSGIKKVQSTFKEVFNLKDLDINGQQFDVLLEDNEILSAGSIDIKIINTPGHTPACCSYLIENLLFTGDTLFMPDYGTGRCDFPMGSAKDLYNSIHEKLYKLPDSTRYFTCHDYQPNGRELRYEATIGESKAKNIQLREETSEQDFVTFREARDRNLSTPKLLLPSIQVNIDGGNLPKSEDNGVSYLKIPIK